MLCELHSVYKIIHCIHCVLLHGGSQIIIHYTVKGQFFAFNLEKNYTRQKKFTQTPSVVSVTNMRYDWNAVMIVLVGYDIDVNASINQNKFQLTFIFEKHGVPLVL